MMKKIIAMVEIEARDVETAIIRIMNELRHINQDEGCGWARIINAYEAK